MATDDPKLRVGAHVLVQLGSELVTDVEQAILECVKNAYDADSPGCLIDIQSKESNTLVETGTADRYKRFLENTETVRAELCDKTGKPILKPSATKDSEIVQRRLHCTGRITIEDNGVGMASNELMSSWLVISNSAKRAPRSGPKDKTDNGRTPLGDKGVGRLGSMKLGDVLVVESATSPSKPLNKAQFRWADCDVAATVDEIPVFVTPEANDAAFKGTRVSVYGLNDISSWQSQTRAMDLAKSLAKLISPFESRATFPVKIMHDGLDLSLDRITNDMLKQAVAEFRFKWDSEKKILSAEARFKKRLFVSRRSAKLAERTDRIFGGDDKGKAFAEYLPTARRVKDTYDRKHVDLDATWFVDLKSKLKWPADIVPSDGPEIADPGSFNGAFYFFHFDNSEESEGAAASGQGFDKNFIKGMSGITILRDGFRVRSQGDWLDISEAMTSGSTYNMRVDNTVGYFALTGGENFTLIEKSDREGFVEDAAYRGFLQIAITCRDFANNSLENVRRSLDDYAKTTEAKGAGAKTPEGAMQVVENNLRSAKQAKDKAETTAAQLQEQIKEIEDSANEQGAKRSASKALRIATSAVKAIEGFSKQLSESVFPEVDIIRIKQEFEDRNERALMLLESAAVGLSARGLAHELRTHLVEIRQRANAIEKIANRRGADPQLLPSVRAIRASCNSIINAAGLIDPMLPRTRAVKEEIDLRSLIEEYLETRRGSIESSGIKVTMSGAAPTIRANRSRLIQVVDNLVRNSIYWLRRGEATGEIDRPKKIQFRLNDHGFVMWDNGPGVKERIEGTLFDMFVTGRPPKDGGQGLGLFIVKQLLQIDGCDIALQDDRNEEGRRYKFSVDLGPLVKA